ncbi:protein-methionine-sulfoxide reductase heme-binding subunit MsrQ [Chitiniphilus shinanonensis]|uniref:Protein-methionine-sulfoxide reductase heme-binding subunit MsrQ n=1 Tax=Chitiniphilus shinanonensis TaxID=553088 RepID=A0ABQ6BX43_9NEIS|nr:protein-methionine-sulfoxide reductase heme-binding subunit MsrQ [Chitiniphilus shinanonensis]GLS06079.1 protein-methionine-sulfoxide reductase heme-binding subunit MsrQ [Chitiniphilus shinanonensis]
MRYLKIALFLLCLGPLAWTAWHLPAAVNPVEYLTHQTGLWALILLLITLSITPLRRITGRNELLRLRRMLGLFAFFHACLHFLVWLGLDHLFDLAAMWHDVLKRPFITVGFSALVLMIPLAATSTDAMMRRLKRNWARLHRLVYAVAVLAVLHFWWLVKRDVTEPAIYGAILAILLVWRVDAWQRRRKALA